jgi:hypothetical protein
MCSLWQTNCINVVYQCNCARFYSKQRDVPLATYNSNDVMRLWYGRLQCVSVSQQTAVWHSLLSPQPYSRLQCGTVCCHHNCTADCNVAQFAVTTIVQQTAMWHSLLSPQLYSRLQCGTFCCYHNHIADCNVAQFAVTTIVQQTAVWHSLLSPQPYSRLQHNHTANNQTFSTPPIRYLQYR